MMTNSSTGRVSLGKDSTFNGVRVFSATMVAERERLGEKVTDWLRNNPQLEPRDIVVTQSSDEAFHCIAITVFYWEEL
jgi:exonuclease V gamma subunit